MTTEQQYKNYLKDVVIVMKENIQDLKQRQAFADLSELEYINTKLFAYNEMISIFRMEIKKYKIKEGEIGLDSL